VRFASLHDLDRRVISAVKRRGTVRRRPWVERGPFALVKSVPQIGFVVIAAVLLGNLAVLGNELADRRSPVLVDANGNPIDNPGRSTAATAGVRPTGPIDVVVGPDSALSVRAYLAERRSALRALIASGSTAPTVAVVSFSRAVRPSDLLRASYGLRVTKVLVHVHVDGRPTGSAVVVPGPGALASGVAAAVRPAIGPLREDATNNQRQGDTTKIYNDNDKAQRADYYAEAKANTYVADQLQYGGPYIYAVVVTGSPRLLLGAASHKDIRLIDVGGPGLTAEKIEPRGIFPEDVTTISDLVPLRGLR
jgi:hypothetical protein